MDDNRLIHGNEKVYFIFCLISSLVIYSLLIISIIGLFYLIIGIIFLFFVHGMAIAYIRSNGVKVTEQQLPRIALRVKELSYDMGLDQVPDVFVIQSGGVLNAFATRFFGRNFIVLYAEVVEVIETGNDDELDFIIAHELAHIQRKHISKTLLILPALWFPFLGKAYSRACEYTCDRMATAFTGNSKAAVNALVILTVGKELYKRINIADYLLQQEEEKGFFIWLSHVTSTHPPVPIRIKEVQHLREYPELYGCTGADFKRENVI